MRDERADANRNRRDDRTSCEYRCIAVAMSVDRPIELNFLPSDR
jgi:hypothetical protein